MTWNFDLDSAPRDGSEVILAIGGTVIRSYWCKPKIDPEHWCMLTHKQTPEAWMPWPAYPEELAARAAAVANLNHRQEAGERA